LIIHLFITFLSIKLFIHNYYQILSSHFYSWHTKHFNNNN
jgi:hypothetical protein